MGLGTSIGALLVASWFATGLTGALLLQTYIYFRYKPKDDNKIFALLVSRLLYSPHVVPVPVYLRSSFQGGHTLVLYIVSIIHENRLESENL